MWKRGFETPGQVMPTTMAVDGGWVCFQTVSDVVCLDAIRGKKLWRSQRPLARSRFSWSTPTLVIHDGVVLTVDRLAKDIAGKSSPDQGTEWLISSGDSQKKQPGELVAFSLDDGRELWRAPCFENYNIPLNIFAINDVVWVGNLRHGDDPGYTQGRDLHTGQVVHTIPPQKAWGHHRCYRDKATVQWLMVGRGGIQFVDPATGAVDGNSWLRGTCQYDTMPANGLVYVPQHSCECQPSDDWPTYRCVLTFNRKHFIRLHGNNPNHAGIVVCTYDPDFAALAERIHQAVIRNDSLHGLLLRTHTRSIGLRIRMESVW